MPVAIKQTDAILQTLNAIRVKPDQIIEIRALKIPGYKGSTLNAAGYFEDMHKAADAAARTDARGPEGIYVVLNDINPDLLARGVNKMIDKPNATTADADIRRRYWLPIDIDPDRPRGISSNAAELATAQRDRDRVVLKMREWFEVEPGIRGLSGNGAHLLYRVDLPNDDNSRDQIKAVLEALQPGAAEKIIIDSGVHNAARIWKLYGTTARKGDSTADRPHRVAELEEHAPGAGLITAEQLAAFAPAKPAKVHTTSTTKKGIAETADTVEKYLSDHGVNVRTRKQDGAATVLILDGCPMIPDHGHGTDTAVIWSPDGLGFSCLHARCQGFTWHHLREKIDPEAYRDTSSVFEIITWAPNFGAAGTPHLTVPPKPAAPILEQPAPGEIKRVANFEAKAGTEDEKTIFSVPVDVIAGNLRDATGDWPRRISGKPFVLSGNSIEWLTKTDELFAWMQQAASPHFITLKGHKLCARDPRTKLTATLVSRQEFFEHIEAASHPNYAAYETLPHYPLVDNLFYLPKPLPVSDGNCLRDLLRRLNADSEEDRALMCAAMMTPGWGGPCGARPAFVFTSEYGRGVGKSETAQRIMQIWNGWVTISPERTDWREVKSRLLDDDSLIKRCVYLDNVKGRISGADIESLLTSPVIDGKRMYVGQFSRPNRLTYFITSNHPSMSEDVADRAVPIKIGKQAHGSDWMGWVERFMDDNCDALIADLLEMLQSPDKCTIATENLTRWASWERAILAKFPNGNELAALIKKRRPELNAEIADADEIWRAIDKHTTTLALDLNISRFRISNESLWHLLVNHEAMDRKKSKREAIHIVRVLSGRGALAWLHQNPSRSFGRNWLIGNPEAPYSDVAAHLIEVDWVKPPL